MQKISIIIPILNEEKFLLKQQSYLKTLSDLGHEIIIVDGGSSDNSQSAAQTITTKYISTKASRGYQQHAGAEISTNDTLVFLHIDTELQIATIKNMCDALSDSTSKWGRFNVAFSNQRFIFKVIAWLMNKRSCMSGIVTGDHALFINRKVYFSSDGFADMPLMEDIEFSKRLKKHSHPICLNDVVITSSRKWENDGVIKTVLLMWRLRIFYFLGAPVHRLAEQYYSS